jgi:hypothetical protein
MFRIYSSLCVIFTKEEINLINDQKAKEKQRTNVTVLGKLIICDYLNM